MSDVDAIWDALDTLDEAFEHTDPPECASKAREQLAALLRYHVDVHNEALEEAAKRLDGWHMNVEASHIRALKR